MKLLRKNTMASQNADTSNLFETISIYLILMCSISYAKLLRGIELESIVDPLDILSYLVVDVSLLTTLVFGGLVLSHYVHRPLGRLAIKLMFYILVAGIAFAELINHLVFAESGFHVDWSLIVFGLERSGILMQMIKGQLGFGVFLYGTAVGVFLLAFRYLSKRYQFFSSRNSQLFHLAFLFSLVSLIISLNQTQHQFDREEYLGSALNIVSSFAQSTLSVESRIESDLQLGRSDSPDFGEVQLTYDKISKIRNVVVVMLESTRARSVAPYADVETTPYFKQLASHSLLMERAYSTSPHTSRAVYSILCGQFPRSGKGIIETTPGGISRPCLPHLLGQLDAASGLD